jgi:hypothetical protein
MITPFAGGGPDLAAIQQELLALREKDAEREREIADLRERLVG